MNVKYFTPKEANKRLPLVRRVVDEILERGKRLRKLVEENRSQQLPEEAGKLQEEIETLMDELETLGCFFKDWNFEIGLVDFPALINGEEVLLCWRSDEPIVRWYHSLEDGFAGRRLIPENLLDY